jgi:hypothetical protein
MQTSIFRPSTTVPWRRSLAWSASELLANVTKPNPCMPEKTKETKSTNEQKHAFNNIGTEVAILLFGWQI